MVQTYCDRVAVEAPYELRRHPGPLRLTLLAAFCHLRSRELRRRTTCMSDRALWDSRFSSSVARLWLSN